jgi:hypothetical protein
MACEMLVNGEPTGIIMNDDGTVTRKGGDNMWAEALADARTGQYSEWPNKLGADLGAWEIVFPVRDGEPYRARWFKNGFPVIYGEGLDLDDAIDRSGLIDAE